MTDTGTGTPAIAQPNPAAYRALAIAAAIANFVLFADGVIPQAQLLLFGGQLLINNVLAKLVLLVCLAAGLILHPRAQTAGLPLTTWKLCLGYLFVDFLFLLTNGKMGLGDILQSYNSYYFVLLAGPAALAFRGAVPERLLTRGAVVFLVLCAMIGTAQHFTEQPLLYTESPDGGFRVESWEFFGEVRAFSLFSCGLHFGFFCSFCAALGIAIARESPARGMTLVSLSALGCYTTLTRTSYLVFLCASAYAAILTYGAKSSRGRWSPVLYLALAVGTTAFGMASTSADTASDLQNASSLIDRIVEWTYYGDMFSQASLVEKLFGLGLVQHDNFIDTTPVPIDNLFLALTMHIGVVGLVLFSILIVKMWLHLRQLALASQRPFIIAAASLCATFTCSGSFSIMFVSFGATYALAIICERAQLDVLSTTHPLVQQVLDWLKSLPAILTPSAPLRFPPVSTDGPKTS